MPLAYDATIQNQIALRLYNQTYANLTSTDKTVLDGNWSSGTPGGHAGDAFLELGLYANFVQMDGSAAADVPSAWAAWLIWTAVHGASIHIAPDRAREYDRRRERAAQTAFSALSREDTDTVAGVEGLAYTRLSIRRRILARAVALVPMLLPRPEQIDTAIAKAVSRVWDTRQWSWRKSVDSVTFASGASTNPTPTYGSGVAPAAIASMRLWFTSPASQAGNAMIFATEDQIQQTIAQGLTSGRPSLFHIQKVAAGTLAWFIDRSPDQSYTLRALVLRKKPDLSTATGVDEALALMPYNAQAVVFDLALADTFIDHGRAQVGIPIGQRAVANLEALWTDDDAGNPDDELSQSPVPATFAAVLENNPNGDISIGGFC